MKLVDLFTARKSPGRTPTAVVERVEKKSSAMEKKNLKVDATQIATVGLRRVKSSTASKNSGVASADLKQPKANEIKEEKSGDKEKKNDDELLTKDDETALQAIDYYHGYLPREDAALLLTNIGDYLLRVSETDAEDSSIARMKEIILSVRCKYGETDEMRNIIVRKLAGQFFIMQKKTFATVVEVIENIKKKERSLPVGKTKVVIALKNPVPLAKWEYLHKDVKLVGKELGTGEFGVVQQGELKRNGKMIQVAIKSTKGVAAVSKEKIKELMSEARLVRFYKHRNVVRTYGVAVDEQPLYILMEFVDGGSLKKFLQEKKDSITPDDRLAMTLGAARGLFYLHQQSLAHCDVAARNFLITTRKLIKISDFGMSIPLKAGEVHSRIGENKKVAWKWAAPEILSNLAYSHKSDVYAYGLFTYEIFAGEEPYMNIPKQDAKELILQAKAPLIPKPFPSSLQIYWKDKICNKNPTARPMMVEIVHLLALSGAKDVVE